MRYCAQPNCPTLVAKGRCAIHARQHERAIRGTSTERGYDYQWSQYSQARLQRLPVCGMREDGSMDTIHSRCAQQGLTVMAQCTDHITPMSQGGSKWDTRNHLSLCLACNTWKAQTIERQRGRQTDGVWDHFLAREGRRNHAGASREFSGKV